MKFNEWKNQIDELQKKVGSLCVDEISESIFIEGQSIRVGIKDVVNCYVDDHDTNIRYLRLLYTHHKEEFGALLESLESRALEYYEAMGTLTRAVTLPVLPEMTVKRLAGTIDSIDPQAMLNQQVRILVEELWGILKPVMPIVFDIAFSLGEEVSTGIDLGYNPFIAYAFKGGSMTFQSNLKPDFTVEQCLHFMGNFPVLKSKIEFIAKSLVALKEGLGIKEEE